MFESIFTESSTATLSIQDATICMVVALVLGGIIAFTHRKTSKSTTKNFLLSLTIMPLLVQVVIMMVNGNLGASVAVMGAFNLVKFRSAAGNSKEIISIFWAMAIGLAVGMGQILFAALVTVVIAIVLFIVSKTKLGEEDVSQKKLKIQIPEDLDYQEVFEDIFKKYTKTYELQKAKTTSMGSLYELTYIISLIDGVSEKQFIDELRVRNGNLSIQLSRNYEENERNL